MGKIILKVLYAALGVILAFLVYVVSYNSGASTNYYKLLSDAAESENKVDIVKSFSAYEIPFDGEPVYQSGTENNNVVVYNGINQLNLSYYPENKETTYAEIQYMYYFFIFDPAFNYSTINETSNLSGIRFYGNNGYYDFHYVVGESINTSLEEYVSKPQTVNEAILYSARDMANTYSDYGFIFTAVSEVFIDALNNTAVTSDGSTGLGGVTGFDILDNHGNVVDINSSDTETGATASFDFSQQFYTDMTDFKYYSRVSVNGKDETVEINGEEVTYKYDDCVDFLNDFSDNFETNYPTYLTGYSKSLVYNSKLTWTSVGMTALFVVVLIIVYILVFYFKKIKAFIFSDHRRQTQRIVPNKPANNNTKTQFDKVNEQRAKDLAKQRAKEAEEKKAAKEARDAEIKARGNAIVVNNEANTSAEAVETKEEIQDAEFTEVEDTNSTTVEDQSIDITANTIPADDKTDEE
ncbi:MAG: hypothetical protein K6A63_08125 [Acholeplasmatales bacterium]|nr:hypothetical protein [Acholeplasmatales bacterium]